MTEIHNQALVAIAFMDNSKLITYFYPRLKNISIIFQVISTHKLYQRKY